MSKSKDKFNYNVTSFKIKSNWFDVTKSKDNVIHKIGFKGLNLYFQLFKFRLNSNEHTHVFVTSVGLLRNATGYTNKEVVKLLKCLKSAKIIRFDNLSRWQYLYDDKGKILDNLTLIIVATDVPVTERKKNKEDEEYDHPVTENDKYISISTDMLKRYEDEGLNERYYAIYCLMIKYSNNSEQKMNMSIEKIAQTIGMHKDTVWKMVYVMNCKRVLATRKRKSQNNGNDTFEHYPLKSNKEEKIAAFEKVHGDAMDRMIKRLGKKSKVNEDIFVEATEAPKEK